MSSMINDIEYCTLEEAAGISTRPQSQIQQWIEGGHVGASVYVPEQQFLVYSKDLDGGLIGHAVCVYRGLVHAQMEVLEPMLDGERVSLDAAALSPDQPENIRSWNTRRPFSAMPIGNISGWEPKMYESKIFGLAYVTPLPEEHKSFAAQLAGIAEELPESTKPNEFIDGLLKITSEKNGSSNLNYKTDRKYGLADLRVWYGDVAEFMGERKESKFKPHSRQLPEDCPQERQDQFTQLLWALLRENIEISAREAWMRIKKDANSDDPVYDTESILLHADADGAIWNDRDNQERQVNRSSFQTRLSRLKVYARNYLGSMN
jgi:hypothetical protein